MLRGDDRSAVRPALGTMSPAALTRELAEFAEAHPSIDRAMLADAIALAAHLHRGDRRKHGTRAGDSPFIEHPLRNTVRLTRLGCTDGPTLIASVLHDTVEAHAIDIVAEVGATPAADEMVARDAALAVYATRFGSDVAALVRGMSTEPVPPGTDPEAKLAAYDVSP